MLHPDGGHFAGMQRLCSQLAHMETLNTVGINTWVDMWVSRDKALSTHALTLDSSISLLWEYVLHIHSY